ncbi:MAG: aminotransferase class V-fold PLP-dependent enzyme, partial [Clostridium sp.]
MIYLDNAATTFPKPEIVYDVMDNCLRNSCVNAGRGSYKLAKEAMEIIDETRNLIGELVHLNNGEGVIFTPSATIAINQILNGLDWNNIKNVFITPFEHNAIRRTLHYIQKIYKFDVHILPFNNLTFEFELNKAKIMFSEIKPELVLMSHVSNVTGFILPISEIVELSKGCEAITVVDCAQSLGVVDLNLKRIGCDFAVFAGHKSLYGPMGIAGFIQNTSKIKLGNYIVGGTGSDSKNLSMPDNFYGQYEAGSYNIYAIAGLNAALKWIKSTGVENIYKHKMELTNKLIDGLEDIEEIQMYLPKDRKNHIGTISFTVDEYISEDVASILSEDFDIAVRAGHHCAPSIGEFLGD